MNIIEISDKFPTEAHVADYFEAIRWEDGVLCAYCQSDEIGKRQKDLRYICGDCKRSFSVTVNTNLHNTRLSLKTWLMAFSVITDAKKGLSALQLQRNLGIHYETAWSMYHKIRGFMAIENKDMDELDNIVEMDETYIGGKPRRGNISDRRERPYKLKLPDMDEKIDELEDEGFDFKRKKGNPSKPDINAKTGRGTSKIPVVGIVERDGNVIAEVMKYTTSENLKNMVQKYVDEDDTVIITDQYNSYKKLDKIMEHISIDHQKMYSYRGVNTNSIESFWAIIKRGIIGQYHQVSLKYLPNYIAEFVFKYNNRQEDNMFETLVRYSMTATNDRRKALVNKYSKPINR